MSLALLTSKNSPDPNTKVGSCIVNQDNIVIGLGWNHMPRKLDDLFPWDREGKETKYKYVVHAELDAILKKTEDLKWSRIYTTLFPCSECAKAIVESGIYSVFYLSDKYVGTEDNKAAKKIFDTCGIVTVEMTLEM